MDYKGHICPVCNKTFEKGDDTVVCPVCGTPHHRACYEEIGHCVNLNRHREAYDYKRECEVNSPDTDVTVCGFCGAENPQNSRFCNSCGKQLGSVGEASGNASSADSNTTQRGGFGGVFIMDPLGGVNPQEEIGEGVTAGEAAKLVKASTPYFIPQFKQLKEKGKTRFSFVGFIFGGGWMLYRKMYKAGAFFTFVLGLLLFGNLYISVFHKAAVSAVAELYNNMLTSMMSDYSLNLFSALGDFFASLSTEQLVVCIASTTISLLMIALRVFCGIFGNRMYYKHTLKTVRKIKAASSSEQDKDAMLNSKGGVNIPLAIALIASYYIVIYLPVFL